LPEHEYNPDLDGWKTASWSPFTVNDSIADFAYGNGRYVVISYSGIIAWSDDGDIWHKAEISGDDVYYNAVCFGDGFFIAVGNGGLFSWSDNGGENWTTASMGGFDNTNNINGITWGNGIFVAVGDGAKISYSADGLNWQAGNSGMPDISLNDIAFNSSNNRFYVVGNGGNRGFTDNPSETWTHRGAEPPIGSANITKVTIGRYGDDTGIAIVYDGKTAIAANEGFFNFDTDLDAFLFNENAIKAITWGNDYFVAAGTSAMIGYWPSSEPTRNSERYWRALTFPEFKYWEITALKSCNGRFFLGNAGGKIGYSK